MSDLRVSASTTVAAPPEVVFSIIADPRQHPRIDGSGTVKGAVSGPDRLSLGATFGMGMKRGAPYRTKNEVVEFEEGRRIAWKHFGQHRWRYELEPVELAGRTGTRVTETWDGSAYGRVGGLAMKLMRAPQENLRGIQATLVRLKAAAEEDARGTTAAE